MSMGGWRSAKAENDWKEMFNAYLKLDDQEKYAAIAQCDNLQKKYIFRKVSMMTVDDVKPLIISLIPDGYIGLGYGFGDGLDYQDGNFPLSKEWILVKDLTTKVESNNFVGGETLVIHNELMNGSGSKNWGFKGEIEKCGIAYDIWKKPPSALLALEEMAKDWCCLSEYVIFNKYGGIHTFHTWQQY